MSRSTFFLRGLTKSFSTTSNAHVLPPYRRTYTQALPRTGTIPNLTRGLPPKQRIRNVDKVIAVASAKGGVGKSTIAVNLALAMVQKGKRVGILDADIFGPSIPRLLSLSGEPRTNEREESRILPLTNYGLKAMSMGFLVPPENAIVWRGLMVMKALQQLLHEVEWGGLDVLVIDMPPGTGDTQLTITQQIFLDGVAIVSTPQDIALIDAVRGINMFRKVDVPILGIIENMASFTCPHCQHTTSIFLSGGVEREAKKHNIPILGSVPLNEGICADSDQGRPTVVAEGQDGSTRGQAFRDIAENILARLENQ